MVEALRKIGDERVVESLRSKLNVEKIDFVRDAIKQALYELSEQWRY